MFNEAFNALADEVKAQGFLTEEKGNTVNITILEKDDEKMPTCHLCNGCGTVERTECHGTGIIYCGDSFNGYNRCPSCWDSGIEGTGDPDYLDYYPDPTKINTGMLDRICRSSALMQCGEAKI